MCSRASRSCMHGFDEVEDWPLAWRWVGGGAGDDDGRMGDDGDGDGDRGGDGDGDGGDAMAVDLRKARS